MSYWKKNLYIVWICQFLAMAGMSSLVPFLPLFIRELGVTSIEATANWSGLVFAGPFFISFFLAPVWGSLGDKYGRKIMILRAIFGLAVAQIVIGFSQNITHLFLGRLLQGFLSGFLPAAMALVAASTPAEKTGYALGLLHSATAAGNILGPLIGGVLSDFLGFRNVFFSVAGLLFVTGILVLLFVKEEKRSDIKERFSFLDNWKFLLRQKSLVLPSILITLTALGLSFVRPLFVLYVETLDIPVEFLPTITGALYSIVGIFSTISAPWWGKRAQKYGIARSLFYASLISGLMYSIHSFIENPYLLIPVRTALGFGYGALLPLLFTSISNNAASDRKGGILGVGSSFQILGNMTGPIFGGLAAGVIGIKFSFFITGIIFFLIAIVSLTKLKN